MPKGDRGSVKKDTGERRVNLSVRVKAELYDRMRAIAISKGFLSVAEWARSVVISAVGK